MVSEGGNKETKTTKLGPYKTIDKIFVGEDFERDNMLNFMYTIETSPGGKVKITEKATSATMQFQYETLLQEEVEFDSAAEAEAWIKSRKGYKIKKSDKNAAQAELVKALGSAAQVTDQSADFDLLADAGDDSAMSEEMKAALAPVQQELKKQQLEIKNVLTGFGNQCFFMENIEPFVKYATGQKFLLSKQDGDQMINNLEQFQKQSGGEAKEAIDEAMNPDNPARTFSGPRKQGYGYFGSNKTRLKLVSSEKPELIYNALLSDTISGLDDFQRGTPAMYSALVPQIKIFKIFDDGAEVQIPFSTHLASTNPENDTTALLEDRKGRADDVGILGFDFEYEQGDIAMATNAKTVFANLRLLFESVNSFTTIRNLPVTKKSGDKEAEKRDFTFSDLITEGGDTPGGQEVKSPDEYSIRVVLGYGTPKDPESTIPGSSEFFKAAREVKTTLILNTKSYDLDFLETGQMIVTFDYVAEIEERLSHPQFNIFGSKIAQMREDLEKRKRDKRKRKSIGEKDANASPIDAIRSSVASAAEEDKLENELIAKMEQTYDRALDEIYNSFKASILTKVFKLQMTEGDVMRYIAARGENDSPISPGIDSGAKLYYWNAATVIDDTKIGQAAWLTRSDPAAGAQSADPTPDEEAAQDATMGVSGVEAEPAKPGHVNLYWVYFGDVIAAMMEQPHLKEQMEKYNIEIILGQAVLVDSFRGTNGQGKSRLISVNIGDIPISLSLLNDFFKDNIVKPKRTNLPMGHFIKDILGLLSKTLNSRCKTKKSVSARTTSFSTVYHSSRSKANHVLNDSAGRVKIEGAFNQYFLKTPKNASPMVRKDRKDYLIINAHDGGLSSYSGNETNDLKQGIMHYGLARDRGLLKSCSFKKSDIPYAREMYMAGALSDQDTQNTAKLWNVYEASANLFGNPNIKPYFMVFIDPSMPGMGFKGTNSTLPAAMALKLGGYYRVLKVSNSITPSSWETQMDCFYERSISLAENEDALVNRPVFMS